MAAEISDLKQVPYFKCNREMLGKVLSLIFFNENQKWNQYFLFPEKGFVPIEFGTLTEGLYYGHRSRMDKKVDLYCAFLNTLLQQLEFEEVAKNCSSLLDYLGILGVFSSKIELYQLKDSTYDHLLKNYYASDLIAFSASMNTALYCMHRIIIHITKNIANSSGKCIWEPLKAENIFTIAKHGKDYLNAEQMEEKHKIPLVFCHVYVKYAPLIVDLNRIRNDMIHPKPPTKFFTIHSDETPLLLTEDYFQNFKSTYPSLVRENNILVLKEIFDCYVGLLFEMMDEFNRAILSIFKNNMPEKLCPDFEILFRTSVTQNILQSCEFQKSLKRDLKNTL